MTTKVANPAIKGMMQLLLDIPHVKRQAPESQWIAPQLTGVQHKRQVLKTNPQVNFQRISE